MIQGKKRTPDPLAVADTARRAARAIPPLWPLSSSVAVNPFLGQTDEGLAMVAARLGRVAGVAATMPRTWYLDRTNAGEITDDDLAAALASAPEAMRPRTLPALKAALETAEPTPAALPTVADLAAEASGLDWPGLTAERIGHWAAGFFDEGQALWVAPKGRSAYAAWRAVAIRDLTPEIIGLKGFSEHVAAAPEHAEAALAEAVERLSLPLEALSTYFHRLLTGLGGWAQYARHRLWQAELAGVTDGTVTDLLAIRLVWDAVLLGRYKDQIAERWEAVVAVYAEPPAPTPGQVVDVILQEAAERAAQRRLIAALATPAASSPSSRPSLQAAFCIDVRSEVFRRALESLDPRVETLGFAGFFGLGLAHRRFASDVEEARLPVLLTPTVRTCAGGDTHEVEARDEAMRLFARARRAWGRFKLAAVSSFAFVEAAGPTYVGKLLRDGLGLARTPAPNDPAPRLDPAICPEARVGMAEGVLRAMSLTDRFARIVLLAGHGANVANNPHASALHCGACGGYSGEVNARLLAALLNEREVRAGLTARGITIPDDTLFVGALHDTTTDAVTIYDADHLSPAHAEDLRQVQGWLDAAGALARGERALRLPRAADASDILHRSRDWAETRPEWGLAGCKAFVAAPRARTHGRDLGGRAFLHSYDWRQDASFGVLELILTAPVVVASWISLQYYGSSVAPDIFGAGNKLLHNVTSGIGVVEGNGGLLRGGLPWQSVHDGERIVHEPLRLAVVVEAPREAISDILARQEGVRALFDHRWLHLFAMNDEGRVAWRYAGGLRWEAATSPESAVPPGRMASHG